MSAVISANLVKELREKTGVGMMECKKALSENGGDLEKAVLWLRERGLSRAAQKSSRVAAQGVVAAYTSEDHRRGILIEVNSETDFVSKNQDFRAFVDQLAMVALKEKVSTLEGLKKIKLPSGEAAEQALTGLIQRIGENMQMRRIELLEVGKGAISSYVHGDGKIATLVAIEGVEGPEALTVSKDLAMHVAASSPKYLNPQHVSAAELEQEKTLARKKLQDEKKPAEMIEKILMGQMQKYYKEVCLTDQPFVKAPEFSVAKHVEQTLKGGKVSGFLRFALGEGIEKKTENFADEVAAQLSK